MPQNIGKTLVKYRVSTYPNLVFGRYVKIDYEKVDQYGRLVGKVWIDGSDECLEQLS
jgi:endonuclease YncB( thermonuclease family)